jgi:hypothetical protein
VSRFLENLIASRNEPTHFLKKDESKALQAANRTQFPSLGKAKSAARE